LIRIEVKNVDGVIKNMGNIIHWANLEIPLVTEEVADWGAKFARGIAPRGTGALIQAIDVKPGRSGKSTEFTIVSRTPKSPGNPNWAGKTVPYQVFLHRGQRGAYKGDVKTGDHKYMYTTRDVLKNKYPEKIKKSLREAMASNNIKITK
jgi:hypothetical protein